MRNTIIFTIGLLFATWFALTGWFWVYFINLFYSYPAAIFALICWFLIRDEQKWRNHFIPIVTGIGLLISLSALTCLLIN